MHHFKTSTDLGFCIRNRYLAKNPQYQIQYYISPSSISISPSKLSFTLQSPLESSPFLQAEISIFTNNSLHLLITEQSPLHPRYRIPPEDMFSLPKISSPPASSNNTLEWQFPSHKFLLQLSPFSLQVYCENLLTLSINSKSLLNFERYRRKDCILPHQGFNLVDSTGVPGDTRLWEEGFNDFVDEKPRGPSSVGLDFTFCNAQDVYGIAEHSDSLSLRDTSDSEPYRLFNLDVFRYELNAGSAIYGSVPLVYAEKTGVLWVNASDTWVDVYKSPEEGITTHFYSESGVLELVIFVGSSPLQIVEKYTSTLGLPAFPPLFALGYHQCRWNYYSQQELLEVHDTFDKYGIPLDVLWLDIEHTESRNYLTWNYSQFPSPVAMLDTLALHGRKLVAIVDPHFQFENISPTSLPSQIQQRGKFLTQQ